MEVVGEYGHKYFKVDRDRSKGDRRSDGKLNADFFAVEEYSVTSDGVRVSQRLRTNKRDTIEVESGEEIPEEVEIETNEEELVVESLEGVQNKTNKGDSSTIVRSRVPRMPPKSIKCAGRKRTTRLLWLHEFYIVNGDERKKKDPRVYQALQFLLGSDLPVGIIEGISDSQRREIWVLGVWYVPAERVRKYSRLHKGYMFHTELNGDDADKALYGRCPELVRVENCLRWYPMSRVERSVPRVVHADDVKQRRVYVAGRAMHFVCGVTATEDLESQEFRLTHLPRASFAMYPEERLGLELNSASMMWDDVEEVFHNIRQCMSSARQGTSSASFKIPFLVSAFSFWKVPTL